MCLPSLTTPTKTSFPSLPPPSPPSTDAGYSPARPQVSTEPFPPFIDESEPSDDPPHCSMHCNHTWCVRMRERWAWKAKYLGKREVVELRC